MAGVLVGCTDLFFKSKIVETLRAMDVPARYGRTAADLAKLAAEETPALVLLDLSGPAFREAAAPIRAAFAAATGAQSPRIVGFFNHHEPDVRRAALENGCDEVVTRNAISMSLSEIVSAAVAKA